MVEILGATDRFPAVDRLSAALEALLREYGIEDRDVTVVLLGDEEMHARNLADRGVDGPTDVLSYPSWEPGDEGVPRIAHLGDILVGLDVAARQAPEHGHDPADEVLVLAAHGLTHLRGFDHADDAAWLPFREAQRRVLEVAPS